jgi:hypothetical protein
MHGHVKLKKKEDQNGLVKETGYRTMLTSAHLNHIAHGMAIYLCPRNSSN